MAVTVEITPQAWQQAQELSEPIYTRVLKAIDRLRHWPHVSGAKPLRHGLKGYFRLRTGDYRIQFRVRDDSIIVVEKIGHRDGFYGEN